MTTREVDKTSRAAALPGLKVVDADTHLTERHDLWTSRVPAKYKEKVPNVVTGDDGIEAWVFNDGEIMHKPAGASSIIRKDGTKQTIWDYDLQSFMGIDDVAEGSWDLTARLAMMDEQGITAQIVYPNLAGFGSNRVAKIADKDLAELIVQVYNDAVAEMQADSNGRIFPMALVPYWDIDTCVREVERCGRELGLRGITMCSEPQAGGLPDLVDPHWNPLWEVCTDLELPVNFHVGASDFGLETFLHGAWPGHDKYRKIVVGATLTELGNARILTNLLTSTLLERYPKIKWVSVESGIGWLPYVLERLEYQLLESVPDDESVRLPSPTQQFRDHAYACFWFEETVPLLALDRLGFDNVLFETDYPHPACLYPSAVEHGLRVLEPWGEEVQRKVMGGNAAKLYRLPV